MSHDEAVTIVASRIDFVPAIMKIHCFQPRKPRIRQRMIGKRKAERQRTKDGMKKVRKEHWKGKSNGERMEWTQKEKARKEEGKE